MCTDNPIILKRTLNSPTIICLQKKAQKKISTEEDIIESNKLAFNDDIGVVTNHVTSMIEVQAGFPKDSEEHKTLSYRIMCGQLYQQNTIDRAKGIIAKPMPSNWYTLHENKSSEDDDSEIIKQKEFNFQIVAAKKPYFMTYVYPKLKSENDKYIRNSNCGVIRRFNQYGISSIEDLKKYDNKTDAMIEYLNYYYKRIPVGNNPCVVNRISWIFESVFKNYLSKFSKYIRDANQSEFDYRILKSGACYSRNTYKQVYEIYREYNLKVAKYQEYARTQKIEKYEAMIKHKIFADYFKSECEKVCSNEKELCDIVLDICYTTENSKQFAWDTCGAVIVENLLNNNKYKIYYPQIVSEGGEFMYCGKQFIMCKKEVEVNSDDYSE